MDLSDWDLMLFETDMFYFKFFFIYLY